MLHPTADLWQKDRRAKGNARRASQERLRSVRQQVSSLTPFQIDTAKELDAMTPAILDKAFRGEL